MTQGIVPMLRSVLVVGLVLLLSGIASEAIAVGPSGTWSGKMRSPTGEEFEVTLTLDGSGSTWSGTISDAEKGEVPLENVRITATRLSFTFRPEGGAIPANFTGGYIAGDDRITGTFSMRGNSRFVKFERVASDDSAAAAVLEPQEAVRVRHPHKFGATARIAWWPAIHVVKDDYHKINDLTTSDIAFDLTFRWNAMDAFTLFVRGFYGGQGITDDPNKLAPFTDLGLTSNSYMAIQGAEFGVMGFLGNKMMKESRFNPYLTAAVGFCNWELTEDGRGSNLIVLDRYAMEGSDLTTAIGFGFEYEMGRDVALELEWLWRSFWTKDEDKWPDSDTYWGNTQTWSVAFGITFGFG